jgi:hypothetical protein
LSGIGPTIELMLMIAPPLGPNSLIPLLPRQQQAQHVEVELLVKMFWRHDLERREFIDAGVVDQDVELAIGRLRLGEQALDVLGLEHVGLDGGCFAPFFSNATDHGVGPGLGAGKVHDHRRSLGGQMLGDRGPNSLRGASDDGDFAFKFLGHGKPRFRCK